MLAFNSPDITADPHSTSPSIDPCGPKTKRPLAISFPFKTPSILISPGAFIEPSNKLPFPILLTESLLFFSNIFIELRVFIFKYTNHIKRCKFNPSIFPGNKFYIHLLIFALTN